MSTKCLSQKYSSYKLGPQEGLLHRYNDNFLHSSNGYVWIGSDNGLYRYDGFQMKHYSTIDSSGYEGEILMSDLYETENGNILFTNDKGYFKYNPNYDIFKKILSNSEINYNRELYLIDVIKDSISWLRIGDSIMTYDLTNKSMTRYSATSSVKFDTYHCNNQTTIVGSPWIQKPILEVYRIREEKCSKDTINLRYVDNNKIYEPRISDLFIINDSMLLGCSTLGLLEVNYKASKVVKLHKNKQSKSQALTFGMLEADTALWVTSKERGVWKYDIGKEKYTQNITTQDGLFGNDTRSIFRDKFNQLWVSSLSSSTISIINSNKLHFKHIDISREKPMSLDFVFESGDTITVFTTKGVYHIIEDTIKGFKSYSDTKGNKIKIEHPYHVAKGLESDYWLTKGDMIRKISKNGTCIQDIEIPKFHISSIHPYSDSTAVILADKGLFVLNYIQNDLNKIDIHGLDNNLLSLTKILESNNRLFLIYKGTEMYEIYTESKSIDIDNPISCRSSIFSMEIEDSLIYIVTYNSIEVHHINDSIPPKVHRPHFIGSQAFQDIILSANAIWIATSKGLIRTDRTFTNWSIYTNIDGLTDDQFLPNKGISLGTSSIYFTTPSSLVTFDPNYSVFKRNRPKLNLCSFSVNGKRIFEEIPNNDSLLSYRYNENSLKITPGAPNINKDGPIAIFYKEKNDKAWTKTKNFDELSFRLSPGVYIWQFKAINSYGTSSKVRWLKIEILPPFWRTNSFIILLSISSSLLLTLSLKTYYQNKWNRREAEIERESLIQIRIEEERKRIASEMHDDLGGGLTSIKLLAQRMLSHYTNLSIESSLVKVDRYSTELIENMRSIIWSMDNTSSTLFDTLAYLRYYCHEQLENGDIKLDFQTEIISVDLVLSATFRRNLFLIIKEAINNILKHSLASRVSINIVEKDGLEVEIRDNGKGISQSQENQGHGVANMKRRAKDLKGNFLIFSNSGTTIKIKVKLI